MKTTKIRTIEMLNGAPDHRIGYCHQKPDDLRSARIVWESDYRAVMRIVRWADAEGNREARTLLAKGKRK